MEYPDSLCQLVIRNMEIIEEAPKVVKYIDGKLMEAINRRIEERVKKEGWTGVFEVETGEAERTCFFPEEWMVDEEDPDKGGIYELYWTEEGEDLHYLSIAAQIDGSAFFLGFWVPEGITGLKAAEHRKRMHAFFQENPELREYGFEIRKDGYMFTRFSFDPKKLSEEYPDGFTESLNPLDEAFDRVLKAHPVFDKFVKSFDKADA